MEKTSKFIEAGRKMCEKKSSVQKKKRKVMKKKKKKTVRKV